MNKFFKHPLGIVVVTLIITAGFLIPIKGIAIKNSTKSFFPSDHPSYIRTEELGDTYGSSIFMDICLTAERGSLFNEEIIRAIQEITLKVEQLENVDSVTSLSNSDYPEGTSEGMVVEPLVNKDFTGSAEELALLRHNLMDWKEMYGRSLFSDDFRATQILITINSDVNETQLHKVYADVKELMSGYEDRGFTYRIAGDPVMIQLAEEYMYSDLSLLIPVVILVVLLSLFFSFKTLGGTLLPLISVVISTIWTIGIMSVAGVPFTIVSTCLPILLIAVGSAYGIHVMSHYYHDKRQFEGSLNKETNKELIINSLKKVLRPVFLAGFTTIVGFISITTSPIKPLKDFGIFSAVGVGISLIICITFIPALMMLKYKEKETADNVPVRSPLIAKAEARKNKQFDNFYSHTGKHQLRIVVCTVIIVIISAVGFNNLNIESALISYFPEDSPIRTDADFISKNFGGTNTFNVVVKGKEAGDMADPEILRAMDDLKLHLLNNFDNVGKIISYSDYIKRMNQVMNFPSEEQIEEDSFSDGNEPVFDDSFFADDVSDDFAESESVSNETPDFYTLSENYTAKEFLSLLDNIIKETEPENLRVETVFNEVAKRFNYNGSAYNEIPTDPAKYGMSDDNDLKNLISQYLLLYSGSLDSFSDDVLEPSEARMLIQLKDYSTGHTAEVIDEIEKYVAATFPDGYIVETTGLAEMELALTDMITSSQIKSLLFALICVFVIVSISYHSITAGFFGIIPLAFSILINFGIMGYFDINLDMVTSLIASIAIGIGVDYTIHFLERYHQERLKSDNLNKVTKNTLHSSGKGILTNAASVGFGFLVLLLSKFIVLRYIGLLVAIIMFTSSMAALILLPTLLNIFKPRFISRGKIKGE